MKTLYLVRHAKSSWKDDDLSDEKRPLNHRGKHDAPIMGKLLNKKGAEPEIIISSYAERAFITAEIIAEQIKYPVDKIISSSALYLADVDELLEIISELDNKYKSVMLFGHNPGLTDLLNYLTKSDIDNIPTCGAARINLDISSWVNIKTTPGKLIFFEYPKNILN